MSPQQNTGRCSTEATALFERVGQARSFSNLAKLTSSKKLQALAEAHAASISKERKLRPSHAGLNIPYGENLHRCQPENPSVDGFDAWCKKAFARTNLYSPLAKFAGVGIVEAQGYANVVMMFTKHDPDKGEESKLGSDGSCTSVGAILLSDEDVVTRTDWLVDKENSENENSGTEDCGKGNQDPEDMTLCRKRKRLTLRRMPSIA